MHEAQWLPETAYSRWKSAIEPGLEVPMARRVDPFVQDVVPKGTTYTFVRTMTLTIRRRQPQFESAIATVITDIQHFRAVGRGVQLPAVVLARRVPRPHVVVEMPDGERVALPVVFVTVVQLVFGESQRFADVRHARLGVLEDREDIVARQVHDVVRRDFVCELPDFLVGVREPEI